MRRYIFLLSASGFITILLGFVQYAFYPNLRNLYYLGWDEHLYRMFSTFLDPNFAGAIFVLEILLLLSLSFQNMHKKKQTLFIASLIFLSILAVLFTYSRSSLTMFIVSIITFFILIKRLKWFFVVAFCLVIGIISIPKSLTIENLNPLRTASIFGRTTSYERAITIFQDSPFFGVGFNAYRYAQQRYGFLGKDWEETHAGAGVSNSYLFVLVTTGIIGFLLYFNFWYRVLKRLFEEWKQKRDIYFTSVVIASVLGIFIHSLFENTLFYPFIMIWIFILVGLGFVE